MKRRCLHWSPRGYGRCVLPLGHFNVISEHGVEYDHQYAPSGSHGPYDLSEAGPAMDPCSACGRSEVVKWFAVRHLVTGARARRWNCTACGAVGYIQESA